MTFKAGRLAEVLIGSQDLSSFFASAELESKVATDDVTVFKAQWKSFIVDVLESGVNLSGYYDPTRSSIGNTNFVLASTQVVSYAPAGALAIGDFVRLISVTAPGMKEGSKIGGAVAFDWSGGLTSPVGYGACLHNLQAENPGTVTGTGDAINTAGVSSTTTGAIGHLHVTAYTAGTHSFKFQDATTQGGAYTDIAGGAFTNVTAVGAQRLIIPGTIRQFVRVTATIATAAATYAVSFART